MTDIGAGVGGVAQAAGSVVSAGIQADAIKSAANTQAASAKYAQDLIQGRYDATRGDLSPYRALGDIGSAAIQANLGNYADATNPYAQMMQENLPQTPGAMTMADLQSTPGYQFTLDQGLKATQNSAAARGLGVSGAALKGAATYATGLSDQTYNTRFNQQQQLFGNQQTKFGDIQNLYSDDQTSKSNAWNRLAGLVNTGLSGAAQTATLGASAAQSSAQIAQSAGNAQAAAGIATGNALSGGVNGIANAFTQSAANNRLNGLGSSIYGFDDAGTGGTTAGSSYNTDYSSSGNSAFDQGW